MQLLCDIGVHDLSVGNRQLLQHSRNFSGTQARSLAHLDCRLRLKCQERHLLLGKNGCGKSTLLRAINSGELVGWPTHLTTFLVTQNLSADAHGSAIEFVIDADTITKALKNDVAKLEELCMSEDQGVKLEEMMLKINDLYEQLEARDESCQRAKASKILFGLGFSKELMEVSVDELSGGWRARAALAAGLFMAPDVLLLDEPTNHLDMNAIQWLEAYLVRQFEGTLLCVSHDRAFIDEVATEIIFFDDSTLQYVCGNLSQADARASKQAKNVERQVAALEKRKDHLRVALMKEEIAAVNRENRQLAHKMDTHYAGRDRGHARQTDDQSRTKQLSKKLREAGLETASDGRKFKKCPKEFSSDGFIQGLAKLGAESNTDDSIVLIKPKEELPQFYFKAAEPLGLLEGEDALQLDEVSHHHAKFGSMSVPVGETCRIAITGDNGIGKTKLMEIIAGDIFPTTGELIRRPGLRVAHFKQHEVDGLLESRATPLEYLRQRFPTDAQRVLMEALQSFGLTDEQFHQSLETLSGGECARVILARVSLEEAHILVMDEPTNHLDIFSIDALVAALNAFDGGVVFATHNKYFIDAIATEEIKLQVSSVVCESRESDREFTEIEKKSKSTTTNHYRAVWHVVGGG